MLRVDVYTKARQRTYIEAHPRQQAMLRSPLPAEKETFSSKLRKALRISWALRTCPGPNHPIPQTETDPSPVPGAKRAAKDDDAREDAGHGHIDPYTLNPKP